MERIEYIKSIDVIDHPSSPVEDLSRREMERKSKDGRTH